MSEENKPKQLPLPVITIISRAGKKGTIDKDSIILLNGQVITGLRDFSFSIEGEDDSGVPRVNLSLAAYVQIIQEVEKKEKPKEEKKDEPTGSDKE